MCEFIYCETILILISLGNTEKPCITCIFGFQPLIDALILKVYTMDIRHVHWFLIRLTECNTQYCITSSRPFVRLSSRFGRHLHHWGCDPSPPSAADASQRSPTPEHWNIHSLSHFHNIIVIRMQLLIII